MVFEMKAPVAKEDQEIGEGRYTDLNQSPKTKVQSPKSKVQAIEPAPDELAVLSGFERVAFRLVRRMNQGRWKRFWTWCQRILGAGWIHLSTYNLMQVYGIEHLDETSREYPILIVANHRSFFDMYTVSTVLFRQTKWRKQLFFPVRGRFFYQSLTGLFVNLVMGWWSMYPPFFASGDNPLREKRAFDKYSFRLLSRAVPAGRGQCYWISPRGHAQQERRSLLLSACPAGYRQVNQGRITPGYSRLHCRTWQRSSSSGTWKLDARREDQNSFRGTD